MRPVLLAVTLLATVAVGCAGSLAEELPNGFARVRALAPSIREEMRYAGASNFVGRPLAGYQAPACILASGAARALARVQASLAPEGLTLVLYDCYRPRRAVADMLAWSTASAGPHYGRFHPTIDRRKLVALGYIASRSLHSTGTAVDLGLARIDAPVDREALQDDCTAPLARRGSQGALDFGTAFDCFDPKSWTRAPSVTAEAAANRARLVTVMKREGFGNYAREWWHFTYDAGPRPPAADFPVTGE